MKEKYMRKLLIESVFIVSTEFFIGFRVMRNSLLGSDESQLLVFIVAKKFFIVFR